MKWRMGGFAGAALVVLEAPKAVADAVLDDPALPRTIDGVEFHHWTYRSDGTLFAVEGGIDKAPREQVDAIARSPGSGQRR